MSTDTTTDDDLDTTTDADDSEVVDDGQAYGLGAALRALSGLPGPDDPEDAADDDPEDDGDGKPDKPEPKKPEKKRTTVEALKAKRRENQALRAEKTQLAARLADLEAKVNAGSAGANDAAAKLAEIERLAKENPDALLRRYGVDTSAYYETLTKRQLQKGNLPPEILDALDSLKGEVDRLKGELQETKSQREQAQQIAQYEAAAKAFEAEAADTTKYPEFEGYEPEQLLQGAQSLVERWALAGRRNATPADVAGALHDALARQHERIATRKAKPAAPAPGGKGKVKLPPVAPDSGKKRVGEPSMKEVERRVRGALNGHGLSLTG